MYFKNLLNVSCSGFFPSLPRSRREDWIQFLATPFDRSMADSDPMLCMVSGVCWHIRALPVCLLQVQFFPQVQNTALRNLFASTQLEGTCF